ncbi:MAG TPA: glycosyltransferase family 2 protein, partial [Candidatus Limnocylindrales bacterium]|nr:glycosyltransferase family 2 protein [Candidatus Limnocylindrales bacterium]
MSEASEPAVDAGSMVTPPAWRVAALATLGGGIAVGALAATGSAAGWVVAGSIGVVVAELLPILGASRRPPIAPDPRPLDPAAAAPTISVVVAGRDEANVLPQLVADVAAQDHRDPAGRPRFELVVVDDRSTDGTAAAVSAAALAHGIGDVTTVIRRDGEGLPDGKGAALTAAQPDRCRGDVVLVLDADARIGPGFLRRLAAYVAAGADAVTARRRILHAGSSWLAGAQADEQTQDGELQRGRWASGGCSEFRGNGIALRRSLLASVGGWRAAAL